MTLIILNLETKRLNRFHDIEKIVDDGNAIKIYRRDVVTIIAKNSFEVKEFIP